MACMIAGSHLQGVVTARIDRNVQKYALNRIFYLKTEDLEGTDTREFITRLTDDTAKNSPFLIELAINEIPRPPGSQPVIVPGPRRPPIRTVLSHSI